MNVMEVTKEEFYIQLTKELGIDDRFVYLREDENGDRYVEYAFKEGVPEHNRCLSWYDKFQPNALKNRSSQDIAEWKERLHKVNRLYLLVECSPGVGIKPSWCPSWTYEEPVKYGCWALHEVNDKYNILYWIELLKRSDKLNKSLSDSIYNTFKYFMNKEF